MLKDVRNLLNGAVYGATLIIPGVSATIFAIMLGYYDELIYNMNHFREDFRKNARYLGVFVVGVATGAVAFSSVIILLLDNFSLPTMLLFAGLLTGILPLTYKYAKGGAKRVALREVALAALSMVALVVLSVVVPEPPVEHADAVGTVNVAQVLFVFFAGIVNGATLVIPGLSGAFILLIMGLYPMVVASVSHVGSLLGDIGNLALWWEMGVVLAPFGIGALIGCIFMARLMEKLLRDYHKSVYAAILGLILGSLITLFINPLVYQSGTSAPFIAVGVVTFVAGAVLAHVLGKKLVRPAER